MPTCLNNHPMSSDDQFCGTCGSQPAQGVIPSFGSSPMSSAEPSGSVNLAVDYSQVAPQKSSNKVVIALVAVVVLVAAMLLVKKASKPATNNITYTLTVYDEVGCDLGWGYWNVFGMDIDLEVDGDLWESDSLPSSGEVGPLNSCVLSTTFWDVPEGHSSYAFNTIRGDFEYTETEMASNDWEVNLTLGLD